MQIVIDICKDDFEEICMQARMVEDTGSLFGRVRKSIFHGTPLPKGHGDIIDVSELEEIYLNDESLEDIQDAIFAIKRVTPIIKADKAESEGT